MQSRPGERYYRATKPLKFEELDSGTVQVPKELAQKFVDQWSGDSRLHIPLPLSGESVPTFFEIRDALVQGLGKAA